MKPFYFNCTAYLQKVFLSIVLCSFTLISLAQNTTTYGQAQQEDTIIKGFKPTFGSDRYYRIFVGVAYSVIKHRGGKQPYAASHTIGLNYSITENSFHPYYESHFPQALGKWEVWYKLGYDGIRRTNYFGLGNETKITSDNNRYNWLRTHHQYATVGLTRLFDSAHRLRWNVLYDGIQVVNQKNRYISKDNNTIDPKDFDWQYFAGSRLEYTYTKVNNIDLPTKGVVVSSAASYTANTKRSGHSFARYSTDLDAYFPLSSKFSYAFRTGIATLTGNPDFYWYNTIGGTNTLRGYHRYRFYGKTAFYNQNELRWISAVEKGSLTGHVGFFALYDIGRVWQPGETSEKMHFGYGLGIILSPFDRMVASVAYAISNEDKQIHVSVGKVF